jgi:hypothetical protein
MEDGRKKRLGDFLFQGSPVGGCILSREIKVPGSPPFRNQSHSQSLSCPLSSCWEPLLLGNGSLCCYRRPHLSTWFSLLPPTHCK